MLSVLLFFLNIAFVVCIPLRLHMNCRIVFSISMKNVIEILIGIELNL